MSLNHKHIFLPNYQVKSGLIGIINLKDLQINYLTDSKIIILKYHLFIHK